MVPFDRERIARLRKSQFREPELSPPRDVYEPQFEIRRSATCAEEMQFIAEHKFGIKDGKIVIYGTLGREEAELAAINWIAEEGEAYAAPERAEAGGFAAEIAKLKRAIH